MATYESDGTLMTDKKSGDSFSWDTTTDWEAYQSKTDIAINSGILQLATGIPDSGVARWEFEQDATDSWNNNDGTDNSSAGYTTNASVGDYAKSLDGEDDFLNQPLGSLFDTTSDFSVSTWVNGDATTDVRYWWGFFDGSDDIFVIGNGDVRFGHAGGDEHKFSPSYSTGTWIHYVLTFNSSVPESTFYKDGSSVGSDNNPIATVENVSPDIGRRANANDRYFNGDVDDFRVYDKELSSTEVSNLYNTGSISG